jgi:hypothetical protein
MSTAKGSDRPAKDGSTDVSIAFRILASTTSRRKRDINVVMPPNAKLPEASGHDEHEACA